MGFDINICKKNYRETLQDCASTEDKEIQLVLIDKDEYVYNLDKMCSTIKKYNGNERISTCDAFHQNNGYYYFIEFKNQPLSNISQTEIQKKALQSILAAQMLIAKKENLETITDKAILFVVYMDSTQDYWDKTKTFLYNISGINDERIEFGLKNHKKDGLYKEIHTIPVSIFNERYSRHIFG